MKFQSILIAAFKISLLTVTNGATTYVDGSSPELAWYSPKFTYVSNPSTPSGLYWYDEQQGLGSPFVAYADMTVGGGGYTLGVVSRDVAPASSITISLNTGTVSAPFISSHTRDVAYLGLDQDADILYEVRSGASTIFLGSYFGRFDDTNPFQTNPTNITVSNGFLVGQGLGSTFDFHRADRNYDVSIWVRESIGAAPRAIPEPSALLLSAAGLICLVTRRRCNERRTRRHS